MNEENIIHWENIYTVKQPHEVSWTQAVPQTSLDYIQSLHALKTSSVIDIGGGESRLAGCLLDEGYTDISVLDISAKALEKAKERLGRNASKIKWAVSDITEFNPPCDYDIWHDRAAFHFLTSSAQKEKYLSLVNNHVKQYIIIATFSTSGPLKCSGLTIQQYSTETMADFFKENFDLIQTKTEDHITPFNTAQNFLWVVLKRRNA